MSTSTLRRSVARRACTCDSKCSPQYSARTICSSAPEPPSLFTARMRLMSGQPATRIADAQRRRDRLGERTDVHHAIVARHRAQRARTLSVPHQVGVALVLEDRHAEAAGELEQLRHGGLRSSPWPWGSAPSGWCRCTSAATPLPLRDPRARIVSASIVQAVVVHGDADDVHAAPLQPRDRAAVGHLLDDHRVARCQQHVVHQIEPLQRTGSDEHFVGRARDARHRVRACGR